MDLEKLKQKKSIKELLEFGIINIDKPSGPTSFNVSDFVRKRLNLRKTSHFGTLDPKVTGVLPIALNRACKLTGFFLGEDKEYIGIMRIHEDIEIDKIKEIIKKKFTGKILQTPPVKSRVKRQEREREIKKLEILEKIEKDILFLADVQGGTYIRKICDDLGKEIGIGAHMLELRRIRAGIFKEDNNLYSSVNLYDFENAVSEYEKGNEELLRKILIPGEIITELFSIVSVKKEFYKIILNGSPIHYKYLIKKINLEKGDKICIFSEDNLLGIFRVTNEEEIFARSEFVLQALKEN